MGKFLKTGAAGIFVVIALAHAPGAQAAHEDSDQHHDSEPVTFKLTTSYYDQSDGNAATDANIRTNRGPHAAWVGFYRDHADFQQVRAGYEFSQDAGPAHLVWSAQAASGGFLGGSVNAQLGDPNYLILGFGRTNLRNYYNLNFDPNDMATIGLGSKEIPDTEISLYHVWDNRLDTRQHVTHAYLHRTTTRGHRYSIDISYKHGLTSENNNVAGYGLTLTYAWQQYFFRIAHDQYVNFSNATQNRISFGLTF